MPAKTTRQKNSTEGSEAPNKKKLHSLGIKKSFEHTRIAVIYVMLISSSAAVSTNLMSYFKYATYSKWWGIGGAVVLASSLFLLRKKHRLVYGFFEILVGLAGLYYAVPETLGRGGFDPSAFSAEFEHAVVLQWNVIILQILAAIFIIIRGADNIEQWVQARKKSFNKSKKKTILTPKKLASPAKTD